MKPRTARTVVAFVQNCQVVAGNWHRRDEVANTAELWLCLSRVPALRTDLDRGATALALVSLARGVLERSAGNTLDNLHGWRCVSAAGTAADVIRGLRERFATPHLSLRAIAEGLNRSYWHVSHELHRKTEHRFGTHLAG